MSSPDLNANVGESFGIWSRGDDAPVWGHVSTVNIACGFHAGDAPTMRRCLERAAERRLRVCGLVGYQDLAGFGNRFLDARPADLAAEVVYQLGALDGLALVAGSNLTGVRLAGALGSGGHAAQAEAVVRAIHDYDPKLVLLTASDAYAKLARTAGLAVEREVDGGRPDLRAALTSGSAQTVHVTAETAAAVRARLGGGARGPRA